MRYQVIEESQSGHCCFEATVVDTKRPSPYTKGQFVAVCETFSVEDAHHVAQALNRLDEVLV